MAVGSLIIGVLGEATEGEQPLQVDTVPNHTHHLGKHPE